MGKYIHNQGRFLADGEDILVNHKIDKFAELVNQILDENPSYAKGYRCVLNVIFEKEGRRI